MYGFIEMGEECRIGSSVIIGTIKSESNRPGVIRLGKRVHVGDSTIIENTAAIDLIIPDQSEVPARSHVANDGFGHPRFVV
jgi:UDP-3-O-[3-hydroxymyristoyl] glucosamine N-acyltransferase